MATHDLAALRAALARAEDEVFRVQMADGFAFIHGAYDRAVRVRDAAKRDLAAAEAEAHAHAFHAAAIP